MSEVVAKIFLLVTALLTGGSAWWLVRRYGVLAGFLGPVFLVGLSLGLDWAGTFFGAPQPVGAWSMSALGGLVLWLWVLVGVFALGSVCGLIDRLMAKRSSRKTIDGTGPRS